MALVPSSSRAPSGTASGDLSGTYPAPTVAKVNGVAVTGTPSTGFVPTATGASAATWQAASSLPDEWTVAADGSLTDSISDDSGHITLKIASQPTTSVVCDVVDAGAGTGVATIAATGTLGGGATVSANAGAASGSLAQLLGNGVLSLYTDAATKGIEAWNAAGDALRFALLVAGQPMIGVVAAPADGDLSASQVALWFDDTNGVAKLMVKGKSANGTVVTGSIPLV